MSVCVICAKSGGELVNVTDKGLSTLKDAAGVRKRSDVLDRINTAPPPVQLHSDCRKKFTDKRDLDRIIRQKKVESSQAKVYALRPSNPPAFSFKTQCIFCTQKVVSDDEKKKHPGRHDASAFATLEILQSIKDKAQGRLKLEPGDSWAKEVDIRLATTLSLVAAEGRYHRQCFRNFMHERLLSPPAKKSIGIYPLKYRVIAFFGKVITSPAVAGAVVGSRQTEGKSSAFQKLCDYLEDHEDSQFSTQQLQDAWKELSPREPCYATQYLIQKLQAKYGDAIVVSRNPGLRDVLSFRGAANKAVHAFWDAERKSSLDEESRRIVTHAAWILNEAIRTTIYDTKTYPAADSALQGVDESTPELLKIFLQELATGRSKGVKMDRTRERKCTAIGHSMVSLVRPRSFLSPLHLSVGVMLHRTFASKYLVDTMHNLGACCSYAEAVNYENSAAHHAPVENVVGSPFVQYIFDNADFNTRTLNGEGTFHAMGGVRVTTPAWRRTTQTISRVRDPVQGVSRALTGLMEVAAFKDPGKAGFNQLKVEEVSVAEPKQSLSTALRMDAMWLSAPSFGDTSCPGWNAFLGVTNSGRGVTFQSSTVEPVPILNMNPSNPVTIYSCLSYAVRECAKFNQKSKISSFDLPLYIKASQIVRSLPASDPVSQVILRLGGFHLLMSFMAAIGNIMAGSGLDEMWQTCYAKNSTPSMLGGHSYSRAIRAHYLSQQTVITVLLKRHGGEGGLNADVKEIYSDLVGQRTLPEDVKGLPAVQQNMERLHNALRVAEESSRTGALWVQYCGMVQLVRLFVRAERCGDWQLHLYAVKQMHPYFCAAGNIHYAKAIQLYLQDMDKLETVMPPLEYDRFTRRAFFTIRRKEKFCSGTWSDMIIEQTLMRSMKCRSGVTSGRGMSDATLARFLSSLTVVGASLDQLEEFTGVRSRTSEQHVEMRDSRRVRDIQDLQKLSLWFENAQPFDKEKHILVSLSTGTIGDHRVNCDTALAVGEGILSRMLGKTFGDLVVPRKEKVTTLASIQGSIRIRDIDVPLNPNQLFHRFIVFLGGDVTDLAHVLSYELSPIPPALFDSAGMRKGTKSSLVKALKDLAAANSTEPFQNAVVPENSLCVVDGGFLLHKVSWPSPATFQSICQAYVSHIKANYGNSATVVFDGYDSCTKDEERARRSAKKGCAEVSVFSTAVTSVPRETFLSNTANKTSFIKLLITYLEGAGNKCLEAPGDADRLIVTTAIEYNRKGHNAVLVGEDTDLLVLLIALSSDRDHVYMRMPGRGTTPASVFSSNLFRSALKREREYLLFLHAITGCDSTSALYRKGKALALKLLSRSSNFIYELLGAFSKPNANHEEIFKAGETFLVLLYGGKYGETLNTLRPVMYQRTIAKQPLHARFDLAVMPPTSESARQHCYRTYHQVQEWRGHTVAATEWGWHREDGKLKPVKTTMAPAPEELLKKISCNCKTNCSTARCDCKKTGLACGVLCGFCEGESCENRAPMENAELGEDEDLDPDDPDGVE